MEQVDILIIGGGIAGLATAAHLARAGGPRVLLAEREEQPGTYASGRNAGIARRLAGRPEQTALTVQGADLLARAGLLRETGGWLLAADAGGTRALAEEARAFGLEARRGDGSPDPALRAAEHLYLPAEGVIDIQAELRHCARIAAEGGVILRCGCQVTGIRAQPHGFIVDTDRGAVAAGRLVNAAGAWAQEVGRMAGGLDVPFRPLRRHLAWSRAAWPSTRPWAWWSDRPFYLRPDAGGTLFCPCDEGPEAPPERGCQTPVREGMLESLGGWAAELAPGLDPVPFVRSWSGLRTFAPDRGFVLGPDPRNPRLIWAAGLGGHGMTSGLAVGRWVAQSLLERKPTGPHDPRRFDRPGA